jgi:hypothetical protein
VYRIMVVTTRPDARLIGFWIAPSDIKY